MIDFSVTNLVFSSNSQLRQGTFAWEGLDPPSVISTKPQARGEIRKVNFPMVKVFHRQNLPGNHP